ncbi:hypothetical protein DFH08DRAFT_827399 [Mycena albidolilacea]|uniref:Uncharacterized protein n=1 Tax=Mycena albidolilacea TaxID=1033008 RepID=A0AAD7E7D0_9AGAR|nr:hypothetical protein DFH08DRAFT_827399 [Mycena albidolilacea]
MPPRGYQITILHRGVFKHNPSHLEGHQRELVGSDEVSRKISAKSTSEQYSNKVAAAGVVYYWSCYTMSEQLVLSSTGAATLCQNGSDTLQPGVYSWCCLALVLLHLVRIVPTLCNVVFIACSNWCFLLLVLSSTGAATPCWNHSNTLQPDVYSLQQLVFFTTGAAMPCRNGSDTLQPGVYSLQQLVLSTHTATLCQNGSNIVQPGV